MPDTNTNMIVTEIITRNDTAANWESANPILSQGEQGWDTTNNKLKVGDGVTAWNSLDWYGATPDRDSHYEIEKTADDEGKTDVELINAVVTAPKQGDIAIIKSAISADKYQLTGYVYDIDNGVGNWKALDGNYDASTVYFSKDLLTTTAVGNITLTNGQATIAAAGKNLEEVFEAIYVAETKTGLKTKDPAASVSGSNKYLEIGKSASQTVNVTLSEDGNYKYGYTTETGNDGDAAKTVVNTTSVTGVVVDTSKDAPYTLTSGSTTYTPTATKGNSFTVASGTSGTNGATLAVTGTVYHTEGYSPISNLKNMYPGQKVPSGSKSASRTLFTWYVPMYAGFTYEGGLIDITKDITASQVQSLTAIVDAVAVAKTKPTAATATKSWRQYFVAVPSDYASKAPTAKDGNNLDLTVTEGNKVTIKFGETDVEYKVFYIHNAAEYDTLSIALTW